VHTADWASQHLDLFFGAASESMCRVYARLDTSSPSPAAGRKREAWHLSGTLSGPYCEYATTLPATIPLVDCGPGPQPLAEARLPDPCFWTPAMPHRYRARIELRESGHVIAVVERTFGIRPLAASGRSLRYGAKSWVLRGISRAEISPGTLEEWHAAEVAMLVAAADDATCEAASRLGVLLVAELERPQPEEVRRLARFPAVGVIVLPGDAAPQLDQVGHNVLLAQRLAAGVRPADWADVVLYAVDGGHDLATTANNCPLPIIVERPHSWLASIDAGRLACDELQRELAPLGQFAGYIV
jgi:hypothetical protein